MPKKCRDHEDNAFPSMRAMLARWGVTRSQYDNRLARGWTLEKILTEPVRTRGPATDHLGNAYPDIKSMCRAWNLSPSCFARRLASGMPLEKALAEKAAPRRSPEEKRTDHEGTVWPSVRAMCARWGLSPGCYADRLKRGMDKKSALETPMGASGPDGKAYKSKGAMCEAYGTTDKAVLYIARKKGLDYNSALLEAAAAAEKAPEAYEYRGTEYATAAEACAAAGAGVKPGTFLRRIHDGWDAARAAETPPEGPKASEDVFGNKYPAVSAMCAAWGTTDASGRARARALGTSVADALPGLAARNWPGTVRNGYRVASCLGFPWFLCGSERSGDAVLHARFLVGAERKIRTDRRK